MNARICFFGLDLISNLYTYSLFLSAKIFNWCCFRVNSLIARHTAHFVMPRLSSGPVNSTWKSSFASCGWHPHQVDLLMFSQNC